jgi:hypothetical protein
VTQEGLTQTAWIMAVPRRTGFLDEVIHNRQVRRCRALSNKARVGNVHTGTTRRGRRVIPTEVSSTGLRQSSSHLTGAVESADTTLQGFQAQLDSHGQPWGNDDLGGAIGAIYQAALAMVMNCLTSNLDTVDGLGIAADNYDDADNAASQRMTAVQAGHGPNLAL